MSVPFNPAPLHSAILQLLAPFQPPSTSPVVRSIAGSTASLPFIFWVPRPRLPVEADHYCTLVVHFAQLRCTVTFAVPCSSFAATFTTCLAGRLFLRAMIRDGALSVSAMDPDMEHCLILLTSSLARNAVWMHFAVWDGAFLRRNSTYSIPPSLYNELSLSKKMQRYGGMEYCTTPC